MWHGSTGNLSAGVSQAAFPYARAWRIRPQADYRQSLELLRRVKAAGGVAKSGLMVGLGENDTEVEGVLADLADCGCDIVTIGQTMAFLRLKRNEDHRKSRAGKREARAERAQATDKGGGS